MGTRSAPAVGCRVKRHVDSPGLTALFTFRQLQDSTGLAVNQQLAFYQSMDTASHRDPDGSTSDSLYEQIFLNPAVTSVAPDADLDVLPAGGVITDPNLSDHLPALQAAWACLPPMLLYSSP